MASNPQDNRNDGKTTQPSTGLFGGTGLFNPGNTGAGLFGGTSPNNSLFGKSNTPATGLFANLGQAPGNSLFPSTTAPAPQPTNTDANKGTSLFGGIPSTPALFQNLPKAQPENPQNTKLDQNSNSSNNLGTSSQTTQKKSVGLFGSTLAGSTDKNMAQTSGPSTSGLSLFGVSSNVKLTTGTAKEQKKEEEVTKKEEKKNIPLFGGISTPSTGALFGGSATSNLFGPPPPAKTAQGEKKESPKVQTSTMMGSLFGNPTSNASAELKQAITPKQPEGLFGKSTAATTQSDPSPKSQETPKPAEIKPVISNPPATSEDKTKPALSGPLFGGNNTSNLFGSTGSANTGLFGGAPASSTANPTNTNSTGLFSGLGNQNTSQQTPKTSLFGNLPSFNTQNPTSSVQAASLVTKPAQKQTLVFQKVAENKVEQKKTANEQGFAQSKPLVSPLESKPAPKPKIDQAPPSQPKKQASLFSNGLANAAAKPKAEGQPQNKPDAPTARNLQSFKSFTEKPQTQVNMGLSAESEPPRFGGLPSESQASSNLTSKPTEQKLPDGTKDTKVTDNEGRKTYSFLKPKEINNTQIIDYKTLRNQEKGEMFATFLTQSKSKIISSVKMYFTVRTEAFKPRERAGDSQVEWFLTDLTNLLMKNLGLHDESWNLLHQFIRRLINQEKYDKFLFKEGKLNAEYFKNQMIYIVDYTQKYYLNEMSSKELQLFIEKIVNRWNVEKVSLLNFLFTCPDVFYKPSDLFYYMFKHLLESEKKLIETPNQNYRVFITDFEIITKKKLVELVAFYNSKLKNFGMIGSNQEIKTLIMLLQNSKDETVNEVSLKVFLNSINFKQAKQAASQEIYQKIKQTKSFVLMPLRALVHRINPKKHQFVPSPKDLYKYIRGDEWIDWFDIYLSDSSREGLELQVNEPEQILESLCTISGNLILERMLSSKKGILKFFNLLRDENMVALYYRLLQVCIFDERSIGQIDEFYFKKMHFNIEYQQVIEYIISFNEHEKHTNEESILSLLEVKMSLLVKILEVSPEKLVELQRYLFNRDVNRMKKFKTNEVVDQRSRREGQKIIHLFLDTINITSIKNISNKILHKIFRVLSHLLKNQQTEKIVLSALKINRPSFNFMQNALHPLTLNSINDFLQRVLQANYLHDLIFSYTSNKEEEIRMEVFYPFRYKDAEYNHMLKYEHAQGNDNQGTFSIYWLNQIIKIVGKQKFNPYLVYKILEKFYVIPYNSSNEQYNTQTTTVLYQKSKQLDSKIPTIFQNIITCINELTVWEDITRILQFKIIKRESKLDLTNKFILTNNSKDSFQCLLYTLKLIRMIFRLSDLLFKHQETCSNHFIIKTLSAINFISKSKINSLFASNASKNNILLSIIANLQFQRECAADNYRSITWEAEQSQEGETVYHALIAYINNNKNNLDFQQANNFLKRANNDLYESENSIISVSLDLLVEIIKLSPECSIQYTLTVFLPLKQDQKQDLKTQIINKLTSTLSNYIDDAQVGAKIMQFIFNLKYNCGINKLHTSLATKLFDEFIKINKRKERSPKFNAILCKYLLRELDQGNLNYQTFAEQFVQEIITNFKFKDSFLQNYHEFKDTRQIGRMIKAYHQKPYSFFNLNQVERIIEERAIVEIGYQFQYLKTIVEILLIQIIRRKHSQSLINCIYLFNTLLLSNNMILLEKDLPNEFKNSKLGHQLDYNINQPRLYIRDPLELYITETRNSKKKYQVQTHQKNNIIQWILDKCHLLSDKITTYIKFVLTINKYLYSNNPVSFTVQRNDIAHLDLFSHLSLGKMNFTAIELFGKSSSDAIDAVQGIASNLINRLIEIRKGSEYNTYEDISFKQGLKILGFCLEWLRGKERYGENASLYLIKKIQKNYLFLLPDNNSYLSAESIKVLLSTLSMGDKYFSNEAKAHIHETIYGLIERYWLVMQKGFVEDAARSLGELVQQALAVLLIIPPEKNETDIFELLVNIWVKEKNFQFFFNQSRLILELTTIYPEQIVKLQPLTRCEIVSNLSNLYNRYDEDNQRRFDSIAWTWVVKIATELVNQPLSVLVISQVSAFFKHYKERFVNLFELNDKLSKSYVQDLEAALELMACLFSHDLWINFNRKLAEELTYLLSHKLIKVFVAYAQGKLGFFVGSNNDRNLSLVKSSGTIEQEFSQNFDNMTQDNMFITQMKIKMNHCVRNYCILMEKAFKASHYVQKYFDSPVYDNYKYFSSFWDIFNKNIVALFVYSNKQFKVWNSLKKLNDTLGILNQCYNSPHTFVENGYLSTIIELPKNQFELFSDIYLLNYLISELAVIHYLKEKLYVNKFNNLLSNHIETFGKKIKEHVDNVKVECRKTNVAMHLYIKEEEFSNVLEIIDANKSGK